MIWTIIIISGRIVGNGATWGGEGLAPQAHIDGCLQIIEDLLKLLNIFLRTGLEATGMQALAVVSIVCYILCQTVALMKETGYFGSVYNCMLCPSDSTFIVCPNCTSKES